MPIAYFASKISSHLGRTPERFLVAADCIVGRSGWQSYRVGELPQDAARDLGIDISNASASVNVYRPVEEVYAPASLAALEGKPICDQHPPDDQFVTPDNIKELQMGHVQNVRKGEEPMESGEWPVIADLIITHEPLISKVESGDQRELSLGYSYELAKDGGKLVQTNIIPNHCAVVKSARAGPEARICDAAPATDSEPIPPAAVVESRGAEVPKGESDPPAVQQQEGRAGVAACDSAKPEPVSPPVQARENLAGSSSTGNKTKERPKMDLRRLFGLGLKALATDAETKPEDLAEAAEAFGKEKEKPKPAEDRRADDSHRADDRRADDRRADDVRPHADDRRARMHAALDKMLAGERPEPEPIPAEREPVAAEDVDLEELRDLLSEFFEEEEAEPAHQEGAEGGPEPIEPEPVAADCGMPRKGRAGDQFIEPIDGPGSESAGDALDMLNALKPFVARTRDAALIRKFNGEMARFSRSAAPTNGGYGRFAEAARHRAADVAPEGTTKRSEYEKHLQAAYDQIRTGKKPTEVK